MHRIRHRRAHAERRGLIPALTDVLGNALPVPSISLPLSNIPPLIPLPTLSSSASGSLSDTSSSSSISSTQISSSTPSPTPTPTPTSTSSVYETTLGGKVHTITTFIDAAPSASPSLIPPKSFLQNKVLSGVVFALVGLIGLVVLLAIATFALRRKRNNKLLKEAVSFDPSSTIDSTHHYGAEKGRLSMGFGSPRSSDDHGYAFGANYAQGHSEKGISFPQPPARALSPQGYTRGPAEMLPVAGQAEGINWGPNLAPFAAPLPPTFGAPNQTERTVDERAQSQNQILKVANE